MDFCTLIKKDVVTAKPSHVATGVFPKAPLGEHTPSFAERPFTAFFPAAKPHEHNSLRFKGALELPEHMLLLTALVGKSHLRKGRGTLGQAGQARRHFCPQQGPASQSNQLPELV